MYIPSKFIEKFESFFIPLSLFFLTGGLIPLLSLHGEASQNFQEGSNALEQVIFLLIHLIAFFLLLIKRNQVYKELIKLDKFILFTLLLIMVVIIASTFWSKYPDITFRRSIALWGTTFFGVYFSTCYTFKQQIRFLSQVYALTVILSFIAGIILPSYGIMSGTHVGAWRGIFLHKNGLGSTMALSTILFLLLIFNAHRRKYLDFVFIFLSFALLVLSKSTNSLLIFILLVSLFLILSLIQLPYEVLFPFIIGITLAGGMMGLFLLENLGFLFDLLGKDLTFTGRTDIWIYVWEAIDKKFWFGYGYQGFWRGFDSDAASVWYALSWQPTHPHSGILELLLIFGFVWTSIFLVVFIQMYVKAVILARRSTSSEYMWPVLFFTYTLIANIAETNILSYNSLSWVLFIMSAFAVIKPLQSHEALK